jgi:hypothetical protein
MSDDNRLEDAFRAGLQRRADDVDMTVDLLGPATVAARAQRRRRVAVTGAVGLAAAALVTVVAVQDPGGSRGDDGTQVSDPGPSEPLPTRWRTETWHGLQVEVPADWAWGASPGSCGVGAVVSADGRRGGVDFHGTPYVGRPVSNTDICGSPPGPPRADRVWFDADVPVGENELGDGYVETTIKVDGTLLTVATDNPALAEHVLGSVRPTVGCEPRLDAAPTVDSMLMEGMRNPRSAQVCAYARDWDDETAPYELVYETSLDATDAAAYHGEVYDGGRESSAAFCNPDNPERVVITIVGDDPYGGSEVTQTTVVDPICREVSGSPGMTTPLSDRGMKAWSQNGLQVTLYGLIGPQG